jgi:hypothetical protein
VPGAPEDLFWAIGAYGQTLQVHPATDTIVVRLGTSPDFIDHDTLFQLHPDRHRRTRGC